MEIQIQLPDACRTILSRLTDAGHRAYAVGGCVRDSLLGRAPHDWDIATDARPAETQAVFRDFPVIETGIRHGTVTVLLDGEPVSCHYEDATHTAQFSVPAAAYADSGAVVRIGF